MSSVKTAFDLTGRVAVITGGAGLLGKKHAEAIAEMGGVPVMLDLKAGHAERSAREIADTFGVNAIGLDCDITQPETIREVLANCLDQFGRVDILINNAAHDPKVGEAGSSQHWSRLENFPLDVWLRDLSVALTGAFVCSQIIGGEMARRGRGVILNIASDLAVIAPDQRIYRQPGLPEAEQPVKPVTYSVTKAGVVGLTRYLATYWAEKNVRVNSISPGGVFTGQEPDFVRRLTNLIPLGRMAEVDEYKAAIVFMVSDASAYMTGTNLIIDGGRTCW
ncbi:MAG TPA: SDR family oxidoreductase [Pyrinomonadaceae bacterium]|jgi:NAD(P)-dependent dehydrogenase (short-subunit alcohol dehydrogenase family)|nr:SDR family oxidoreductase [Pyrinomonadaceae bacterium]